jgi:hypothetical protein
LIHNPAETIEFFNQIRRLVAERNVFVDLSGVTRLTPDAIAGLLAAIHHGVRMNANIQGNVPGDPHLQDMLNHSGFREYVRSPAGVNYRTNLGRVRKHSREAVNIKFNQTVANELIEFGMESLTGNPSPHRPSYSILGEAMLNTLNHASAGNTPVPWWASVFVDMERHRACFTFIDQGVGIFCSGRLIRRLKLLSALKFYGRAQILQRLLQGKIPSTTRVPGRGNGLPGMYAHCKANRVKNFTVLANDVIGYAETESYRQLKTSFEGTILYWEVEA